MGDNGRDGDLVAGLALEEATAVPSGSKLECRLCLLLAAPSAGIGSWVIASRERERLFLERERDLFRKFTI